MNKTQGSIGIRCVDKGEQWLLSVTDNGPGIDKKYHNKIFQIFQTLHSRDDYESTGLGLAIVKKSWSFMVGRFGGNQLLGKEAYFSLPFLK
jgi:light-regulated signal transduction histidine kinase (bacteriophytochrome)